MRAFICALFGHRPGPGVTKAMSLCFCCARCGECVRGNSEELRENIEVAKVIVECELEQLTVSYETTNDLLSLVGLQLNRSSFCWSEDTRRKPAVLQWSAMEVWS